MITINQPALPDINLSDMPHHCLVYLSGNGEPTAIAYEAIPELIEVLKNLLRAQ